MFKIWRKREGKREKKNKSRVSNGCRRGAAGANFRRRDERQGERGAAHTYTYGPSVRSPSSPSRRALWLFRGCAHGRTAVRGSTRVERSRVESEGRARRVADPWGRSSGGYCRVEASAYSVTYPSAVYSHLLASTLGSAREYESTVGASRELTQ